MLKLKVFSHRSPLKNIGQGALLIVALVILYRQVIPLSRLIAAFPLNDFSVYLDGVKATLASQNPYKLWFFDRYNYSPATTILLWPLTLFPVNIAEFLFTGFSIISLWLTLTLIQHSIKVKVSLPAKILIFALVLKTFPAKLTLSLGQINLIILWLLIASFFAFTHKRRQLSGFFLGIATVIKLTPAPLIIFYVLKREWGIVKWFFLTLIAFTLIGIAAFGSELTHYFYLIHVPSLLAEVTRETLKATYMNQGIAALLGRLGIFDSANTIIRYLISGVLFFAVTRRITAANTQIQQLKLFALLTIVVMIFLPLFVWQHHYVFLLPAWVLLLLTSIKKPLSWVSLITALSYILLNFYFKDASLPAKQHPLITTHFLLTAILIFIATLKLPGIPLNSKQQ